MSPTRSFQTTCQRRIILEELRKTSSHPTADELYEMVRQRLPRVSLGTVYRNLELLSERNVILKLSGGAKMHFDGNPAQHYHIRCIECDRVDDVPFKPLEDLEASLRPATRYEVLGHRLEFFGICPRCKQLAQNRG